jgi:hypothetical protein
VVSFYNPDGTLKIAGLIHARALSKLERYEDRLLSEKAFGSGNTGPVQIQHNTNHLREVILRYSETPALTIAECLH